MELILRDDVEKVGRRGDVVKVKDGYARNFLLPRGLGMPVNATNKAMVEKEKKASLARLAKEKAEFEALAARIGGLRRMPRSARRCSLTGPTPQIRPTGSGSRNARSVPGGTTTSPSGSDGRSVLTRGTRGCGR